MTWLRWHTRPRLQIYKYKNIRLTRLAKGGKITRIDEKKVCCGLLAGAGRRVRYKNTGLLSAD
jgi:hypothetical protein